MSKLLTIDKLLDLLNTFSPFRQAEAWDNVGLMVGDPEGEVDGILLALDPTQALLEECRARHCNTIITHHPPIFHPLKSIRLDQPIGRLLATALKHRLNLIACHTNLDIIVGGVSDLLAAKLSLDNLRTLQPTAPVSSRPTTDDDTTPSASTAPACQLPVNLSSVEPGLGRIGELKEETTAERFLNGLLKALDLPAVQIAGPLPATVRRVAVCGGSGSELAQRAREAGADIYVSAEIKHATARWAEEQNFCLVDAGHYHSENPMMTQLAEVLRQKIESDGYPRQKVERSGEQRPPFTLFTGRGRESA